MLIVGKGGEGKSRIGLVLKRLMGDAASNGSVQKVENNRFARADLERRLLMIDDDMDMNALTKTNYIKTIVTAEAKLDLERKGVQSCLLYTSIVDAAGREDNRAELLSVFNMGVNVTEIFYLFRCV